MTELLSPSRSSCLITRQIDSPLGPMLAVAHETGIALLDFADGRSIDGTLRRAEEHFANKGTRATIEPGEHEHLWQLESELAEYFAGKRREFTVPLAPHGTAFELRTWQYLRTIPFGQTRSYGQQARAIGSPQGVRAVGRANGRNCIAIVVPCHRVIGASGDLTGYAGGLSRKRWLLDHERNVLAGLA